MHPAKYFSQAAILLLLSTGYSVPALAQKSKSMIYDKTDKHYASINFDQVDPLEYWNYSLQLQSIPDPGEPKQLGQLMITRNKTFIDKSVTENGGEWAPFIVFEIYDARDYAVCQEMSKATRAAATCAPGEVAGGDVFRIGPFVFLNQADCPACMKGDTKVDYCRPVVDAIFSKIDAAKVSNIGDLIKQLPIKAMK